MRSQKETLEEYGIAAKGKAGAPALRLLILGALAGACIALGAAGSMVAGCGIPGAAGRLMSAAVFPVGLAMVVVTGAELFTGNHLMLAALLQKRVTAGGVLRNWALVFLANFAGAALVAVMCHFGGMFSLYSGALAEGAAAAAQAKCAASFGALFLRGALCNLCVCLAVWMAFAARNAAGKLLALYGPIFLFVLCGFEHSVANMFIIPAGMLSGAAVSIGDFLLGNLLPVTLGNLLGGAVFAGGALYVAGTK